MPKFDLSQTFTFLIATAALIFLILTNTVWNGQLPTGLLALIAAGLTSAAWLIYRTVRKNARLPHTGLAPVWLLGLAAAGLSTWFSPDPRMALERLAWVACALLVFYLLLDGLEGGLNRQALQDALLTTGGLLAALAGMEIAAWHSGWWQAAGGLGSPPPFPYRLFSLIGHANTYMAYMNLCAPLAVVSLITAKTRARRFLSLLFLAFYAFSVPFASSRGGILSLLTWSGTLLLLWLSLNRRWKPVWAWARRRWLFTALAGLAGLIILSAAAYRVNLAILANPSHGSGGGILSSREGIWNIAIAVWRLNPWTGAGPGRFTQGWLQASQIVPPGFWAPHAHNLFLQALAETGPLGLLALLALLLRAGWSLWSAWRRTPPERRAWSIAALAALAGFLVHSIVDDFSIFPPILAALVLWVAMVWSAGAQPLKRSPRISLGWLVLPLGLVCLVEGWNLWAGLPAYQAVELASQGRWEEAAQGFDESIRRDPAYEFYYVQAGLAWDQVWQRSANPADLERARASFRAALAREPGFSLLWANLAALDHQAGQTALALTEIDQAIQRSPGEPKYTLTRAWMLEQSGQTEEAFQAYSTVIRTVPAWANHPFWTESELRRRVVLGLTPVSAGTPDYWQQAELALNVGQIAEARRLLAFSDRLSDPSEARALIRARLDETTGGMQSALPAYRALRDLLAVPPLNSNAAAIIYNGYHYRIGLPIQLVSGIIHLSGDYGQFDAMQRLYTYERQTGQCQQAAQTWFAWHAAQQGFASPSLPNPPNCP